MYVCMYVSICLSMYHFFNWCQKSCTIVWSSLLATFMESNLAVKLMKLDISYFAQEKEKLNQASSMSTFFQETY